MVSQWREIVETSVIFTAGSRVIESFKIQIQS